MRLSLLKNWYTPRRARLPWAPRIKQLRTYFSCVLVFFVYDRGKQKRHNTNISFYSLSVSQSSRRYPMRAIRVKKTKLGHDRRRTVFFTFTCGTHPTTPYGIKMFLHLRYKSRLVGKYPCFKIAFPSTFHPDTSARKIGATDIGKFAIEDHELKMNTRTQHRFKSIGKTTGISLKILQEGFPWFLGIYQAHTDTLLH